MTRTRIASLLTLGTGAVLLSSACMIFPPRPARPATTELTSAPTLSGPVPETKLTAEYVRQVGRTAFFWAWPMVNLHNRKAAYETLSEPGLAGGVAPVAPPNHLAMLHDYIEPSERAVACPNQDVVYGQGVLALDREPVVLQVPNFGERFWVFQLVDQRTDSFANLGTMHGTMPGAYLVVGPNWKGKTPKGIVGVLRSPTALAMVVPRVFRSDSAEDLEAVQPVLQQIAAYPLSSFDGKTKKTDWSALPKLPGETGNEEVRWVSPDTFFDELPQVLDEVPPLKGEEAQYAEIRSVLAAAEHDPRLKEVLRQTANAADRELVAPLLQFRNWGVARDHNWSTIINGADFGTDYFTRTAVARSNIFVNKPVETAYFYQDLDSRGARLTGAKDYAVTFPKGQLPPVKAFWSLTLYNEHHFFHPNALKRYSLGTKSAAMKDNSDGSLTIYVGATPPRDREHLSNWLPAPRAPFSLYLRSYWPDAAVLKGEWTPPAVIPLN